MILKAISFSLGVCCMIAGVGNLLMGLKGEGDVSAHLIAGPILSVLGFLCVWYAYTPDGRD
jgi:hypothetical protein